MKAIDSGLYGLMRTIIGVALGFYFRRIERFHPERIPRRGPVLFTSNHPNSLTDSFVIGAAVPRKVNFVATVQLFRLAPIKGFLSRCGVIPINRVKDNPRAMRSITDTFEACYRVLERGEAVGIFPEGITYDDSQLKEIKSGAARMALDLEHRHNATLGLQIVPVGLTYSAKERYRSDVLAHFGEPIVVASFLDQYAEHRKECISRLTDEIERRLQDLILHTPELDQSRVVEGVKRLYLRRLVLGNQVRGDAIAPRAQELVLSQQIAASVRHVYETQPERAASFARRLASYERWLARLNIADETVALLPERKKVVWHSFLFSMIALVGAPLAIYGWVHRALPYVIVRWAVSRFTEAEKRKSQTSTAVIAAGIVTFALSFAVYVLLFHMAFGWPQSLWYALSLPPASLVAFYYLRAFSRLRHGVRNAWVLMRAPFAAQRFMKRRAELIDEIETVHSESVEIMKEPLNG